MMVDNIVRHKVFRLNFTNSSVTLYTEYNRLLSICQYLFWIKWKFFILLLRKKLPKKLRKI